jgi:uncharacterized membrane protein YtjA (UPF0391 family)
MSYWNLIDFIITLMASLALLSSIDRTAAAAASVITQKPWRIVEIQKIIVVISYLKRRVRE